MLLAAACSDEPTGPLYTPDLPTDWAAAVTNPYFPLAPGTVWQYLGETGDGTETNIVEVLPDTRAINGITATTVRDRVYLDGVLGEDTYDWYAQDGAGNVWYLGEDSKEIENGVVVGTEGSWEWGVNGALPGVIMWADPSAHLNSSYRQEYLRGEAEDWGKVVATSEVVAVPYGDFSGCIRTEDWSGTEGRSKSLEYKWYCQGLGNVAEMPAGKSAERSALTQYVHE